MSWMALVAAFVMCGLSLFRGFQGETFLGRPLGGDFVAFYVTGKILNENRPEQIYDIDLEVRLQHAAVPGIPDNQMLPLAHAPYIGQIYRPFALLPYRWAYVAWLIFSLALYSCGLLLLLRASGIPRQSWSTGFLLGISSMAFLMETWIGGQISVVAFFLFALFVYCRARNRKFLAGFVLSLVMYKVTLLAIPAFMLLCGRRWRTLGGLVGGALGVAAISLATVGTRGVAAWIETLRFFRALATGPVAALARAKYVDIGSFFHLLLGDPSSLAQLLGSIVGATGIAILAWAWWKSPEWPPFSRDLLWAATFCASLVCNVYTPIYDTIVVGAAVALVAGAIRPQHQEAFKAWLLLLYIVPWLTQSFAEFLRFQPFTLVLIGFAYWALSLAREGSRLGVRDKSTVSPVSEPLASTA
jgi:hypothetical protein